MKLCNDYRDTPTQNGKEYVFGLEMQSIEDDLSKLQVKFQGISQLSGQDRVIAQVSQQVRELSQNPLWSEMQKTTVEVQHFKERISPVMKDIESRLKMRTSQSRARRSSGHAKDERKTSSSHGRHRKTSDCIGDTTS